MLRHITRLREIYVHHMTIIILHIATYRHAGIITFAVYDARHRGYRSSGNPLFLDRSLYHEMLCVEKLLRETAVSNADSFI
jgi:hypothetical protein